VEGCAKVGGCERAEGCERAKDVKRQGAVRAAGYEIEVGGGFLPVRGKRAAKGLGRRAVRRGQRAEGGRR
jgi:hypothetical protein